MLLGVVAALVIAGYPVPAGGVVIALAGAGIWALGPTILPAIRSGRARAVGLSLGCLCLAVAVAFDGVLLMGVLTRVRRPFGCCPSCWGRGLVNLWPPR